MPIATAILYVQGILQNLTPPGDTGIPGPIETLITPLDPDVAPDGTARIYVWPARGPVSRLAFPRNTGPGTPAGWKKIPHDLQVFMVWEDSPDDPAADVNFPLLIDYVMMILETSPNPAYLTDPETGQVSEIVNLGEKMTYDFPPPRTLAEVAGMGQRRYDARISCSLLELYQA